MKQVDKNLWIPLGSHWEASVAPTEEEELELDKHRELEGFDSDRVLANSLLFIRHYLWWIEMSYAVLEGDTGRVWEILKVWIFVFAGSTNVNYVKYLLEMYIFLEYEASPKLREAVLNNWLMNLKGLEGHWLEGDLFQEHHNKWVEDMIGQHGGQFDDPLYREIISPNTQLFIELKDAAADAFGLKRCNKLHTSPHLRNEYQTLLQKLRETETHLFCPTRSFGFAANHLGDLGYEQLFKPLADELEKYSARLHILSMVQEAKRTHLDRKIDQQIHELRELANRPPIPQTSQVNSTPSITPNTAAVNEYRSSEITALHQVDSGICMDDSRSVSDSSDDENGTSVGSSHDNSNIDISPEDLYKRLLDSGPADDGDHSDSHLRSGDDEVPSLRSEIGRLVDEWYTEEMLERDEDKLASRSDAEEEEKTWMDWGDGSDEE
ncbi:hypothetical protein PM082_014383 [Marasmius tenuissimus]|nr:hypothetical protein PM082_014383 [Marasmius tenuissimus]